MKLLLDAHTLYWTIYEPEKLSAAARDAISDVRNSLFVSLATFWEMANKVAADRVPLAGSFGRAAAAEDQGAGRHTPAHYRG